MTTSQPTIAAGPVQPEYRSPDGARVTAAAPRSIWYEALRETFARPGARFGRVWILLLAFLGVFAPILANSYPIAVKSKTGQIFSPMLANLFPIDFALMAVFFSVLLLWATKWLSFGKSALVVLGVFLLTFLIAKAVCSPDPTPEYDEYRRRQVAGEFEWVVRTIVPYSPNDRLRDRGDQALLPPSRQYWLGTTEFGEDMLSRMLAACRIALTIGFISTTIATIIGVSYGALMGSSGGLVDLFGMRFIEIVEAIPRLILLLIVTVSIGRSLYLMMVVIGLVSWTSDARFVRAEFMKLRKLDFVQAAVAVGLPKWSVLFRHMLPNGIAPVLVNASFGVAGAILLESVLSFLGLGLGPDDPSWGQMLEQARKGGRGFNWWIAVFPGVAIFLTVFSYILIGEAARDAIDPKLKKMRD